MPVLIAALGISAAVYFFVIRARNAAEMATGLVGVANDMRAAARRLGVRRKTNIHPAEAIDDPNIAIAAIATSSIALDDLPTRNQRDALVRQVQSTLAVSLQTAQALAIPREWSGPKTLTPLLGVVQGALEGSFGLSARQQGALEDLRRAFRLA